MLCPLISIVNNSLFKIQLARFWQAPRECSIEAYNPARSTERKDSQRAQRRVALRRADRYAAASRAGLGERGVRGCQRHRPARVDQEVTACDFGGERLAMMFRKLLGRIGNAPSRGRKKLGKAESHCAIDTKPKALTFASLRDTLSRFAKVAIVTNQVSMPLVFFSLPNSDF
jgi:hypothetical protein